MRSSPCPVSPLSRAGILFGIALVFILTTAGSILTSFTSLWSGMFSGFVTLSQGDLVSLSQDERRHEGDEDDHKNEKESDISDIASSVETALRQHRITFLAVRDKDYELRKHEADRGKGASHLSRGTPAWLLNPLTYRQMSDIKECFEKLFPQARLHFSPSAINENPSVAVSALLDPSVLAGCFIWFFVFGGLMLAFLAVCVHLEVSAHHDMLRTFILLGVPYRFIVRALHKRLFIMILNALAVLCSIVGLVLGLVLKGRDPLIFENLNMIVMIAPSLMQKIAVVAGLVLSLSISVSALGHLMFLRRFSQKGRQEKLEKNPLTLKDRV